MNCAHCVGVITRVVQTVALRARVDADLATHTVTVDCAKPYEVFAAPFVGAGYLPVDGAAGGVVV